jgi:hypothetical protein
VKCQYRECGRKRASVQLSVLPAAGGPPPPFIGQMEAIYNQAGVAELMVVLENLGPGRRRGESCTRPGVASRVRVWELPVRSPSVR